MPSKYGTNYFIIIRHYKWEELETEADIDRLVAASKIFPAETRSNNCGRYTCCYIYLSAAYMLQ